MNIAPTILRPEKSVTLGDQSVTVRDLPWQDSLQFLKLLSAQAQKVLTNVMTAGPDGKTTVNIADVLPKLADLIASADELTEFLLTRSTGRDKEWLASLSTIEMLALIDAALEVNLSDELIALGKKVGGRLGRVLAAKTSTTPLSATS